MRILMKLHMCKFPCGNSILHTWTAYRHCPGNRPLFWWRKESKSYSVTACHAEKHRLVFLGTPQVAANVLEKLLQASQHEDSTFQVAGVVSQPGRPKGRGRNKTPQPSPVEQLALNSGISADLIMCPIKASEPEFLERLEAWQPDLCVTAAYGNILPKKFLAIPKHGTLNIHPSLLPKYRGAAPVQRAVQDGVRETGVSVAFTVRAMDAGPIVAQTISPVDANIQAPELLSDLFDLGTDLLLQKLPSVWSGEAAEQAWDQDDSKTSHASKLSKEEATIDCSQPALQIHNQVRALAGWPGTTISLLIEASDGSRKEETVKVIRTQLCSENSSPKSTLPCISVEQKRLLLHCGDGARLEVLEVQPVGKKIMPVASFINGLNGRTLSLQ